MKAKPNCDMRAFRAVVNCCRMPAADSVVEAVRNVMSRSSTSTDPVNPSSRRKKAQHVPTMPPPTMTTSAVCGRVMRRCSLVGTDAIA